MVGKASLSSTGAVPAVRADAAEGGPARFDLPIWRYGRFPALSLPNRTASGAWTRMRHVSAKGTTHSSSGISTRRTAPASDAVPRRAGAASNRRRSMAWAAASAGSSRRKRDASWTWRGSGFRGCRAMDPSCNGSLPISFPTASASPSMPRISGSPARAAAPYMPSGGSVGEGEDAEVLAMEFGMVSPQAQGAGPVGGRQHNRHGRAQGAGAIEGVQRAPSPRSTRRPTAWRCGRRGRPAAGGPALASASSIRR